MKFVPRLREAVAQRAAARPAITGRWLATASIATKAGSKSFVQKKDGHRRPAAGGRRV
jgi:hypothetical protein